MGAISGEVVFSWQRRLNLKGCALDHDGLGALVAKFQHACHFHRGSFR